MSIGQRLKEKRTESKLSLQKLSNLTGIPISSIRDYENDKYDPPISKVLKLSIALKCSIIWIATGEDKEKLNLTEKELKLIKIFNDINDVDKNEIIEYAEFKANKKIKSNNNIH